MTEQPRLPPIEELLTVMTWAAKLIHTMPVDE